MTLNETTTKSNLLKQTEIANQVKDGSILLSVDGDRICRLNGVGALIWIVLEEGRDGLTITDIVERLSKRFESINREGLLRYEAPQERLQRDTERFIQKLVEKNWLQTIYKNGAELFRIAESVTGTTSALTEARSNASMAPGIGASYAPQPSSDAIATNIEEYKGEEIRPSRRETVTAFIGLTMFDLWLKLTNFSKLLKTVEKWPTVGERTINFKLIKRIRASVEQAQAYYPKKVVCLQNAAVMTCLLRRQGIPAEMVIGAQEFPPKAHSWVEVWGQVVNDRPNLQTEYRELRRL
jgi:Transglutaminase-like superfamily/Coenzyme PQQ synthesis protein D (PqqD)